jgi:hypothetical protein
VTSVLKGWFLVFTMRTHWFKVAFSAALAAVVGFATAQDFPMLQGGPQRTGLNDNPGAGGPGIANLRWWFPNLINYGSLSYDIDNLDATGNTAAGFWGFEPNVANTAQGAYLPVRHTDLDPTTNPGYRFAFGTPSISNAQPHVPQIPANHATWTWTFPVGNPNFIAGNYALYVWLPIGPTNIGGGAPTYSQRYYVYEINYGNGRTDIRVIDSYAGGNGWVRLGTENGVARLYDYDGTNPIRITLHNTVVRDGNNSLTETIIPGVRPIVYADAAMAVRQIGTFKASPVVSEITAGAPNDVRVVTALNEFSLDTFVDPPRTLSRGVIRSHNHDGLPAFNEVRWTFSPVEDSELAVLQDNTSAGVLTGPSWTPANTPAGFRGTNYLSSLITDQAALADQVTYSPTLESGSYEVWAWVPGSGGGLNLGTQVTYEIVEGVTVTTVVVNQDTANGWVRLGTRRFNHDTVSGDVLRVRVTNLGSAADVAAGRVSYADTIRFIGANDTDINSTPVQTRAIVNVPSLGGLIERPVVIGAAENGRIYCMDAVGNGDGTTNVYWTYPSTPDADDPAWTDPNQVAGLDGPGGQAIMPSAFNLSSALVQRIGGVDYLFIASTNGRVYCIEMAGRGDMNLGLRKPGTTTRSWTWPDDYPASTRTAFPGPKFGSVAFGDTPSGPMIYVGTEQGRVYSLDATGNANRTTNVNWVFPPESGPGFGRVDATPTVAFNSVYVGFRRNNTDDRGRFFSLNWETGAVQWEFNQAVQWDPALTNPVPASDFVSGAVAIPQAQVPGNPDTIVVANENLWITALDAGTGALLWTTNELSAPVLSNLSFTPMIVYNSAGALVTSPIVLCPLSDGRWAGLFARTAETNVFGGNNRLAWGYNSYSGDMETSMAVGRNFMYGADSAGVMYAWNNDATSAYPGVTPPGQTVRTPNDPVTIPFRNAKIKFITKTLYDALRLPDTDPAFPTYAQATNPANAVNRNSFEWGETVYAMAYDFPAQLDPTFQLTQVEFRFAAEGVSVRNLSIRSRRFDILGAGNPPNDPTTGEPLDGVAVISYTLQGNGTNAMPPGTGTVTFSLNADFGQGLQSVPVDPSNSRRDITIANPLGVAVRFTNTGLPQNNYEVGYTTDPTRGDVLVNGSPSSSGPTPREDLLLANVGLVPHNQQGSTFFSVYDRSLMTLLRGPGRGLDLVRVQRADLVWMGGALSVEKPIDPAGYPSFEDLPTQFPNISLDYPDIRRENYTITKEKFGSAENPVTNAISLNPPDIPDLANPTVRTINPTRMDFDLNVPRFQPANVRNTVVNSAGLTEQAGYYGQLTVYIDGTSNNQLDLRGRREAYRTLWLGGSVPIDEKIAVGRTELDLGSLAQGTGFAPLAPWLGASPFSPWSGPYQVLFKEFRVYNEGNVNMLDLRVAKATDTGGGQTSWGLGASANNDAGWIDTMFNLWSDIDSRFALNNLAGNNRVLLQKARVGDRNATELFTNPIRRDNPNLGVIASALLPSPVPAPPRLAVTIPIGTPVGTYINTIRVIEDNSPSNDSLRLNGSGDPIEIISEPALALKFTVRESRITNGFTANTAPMVHGGLTGNEPFLHQNLQPTAMRDLNGTLVVAFASNSAGYADPQPAAAKLDDPWRLYFSTVDGVVPSSSPIGQNPLRDLMAFGPQAGRWFRQAVGPFPTQAPNDPILFGPDVLPATAKFTEPAFARLGGIDPFTGVATQPSLVFVGEAQVQTSTGRELHSKLFFTTLTVAADGTISAATDPVAFNVNPGVRKSKPALVQTENGGTAYYTVTGNGQSQLHWAAFEPGNWTQNGQIALGNGFESVGAASVHGRIYEGEDLPNIGLPTGQRIIELTFSGKLKGRPNREIYIGRIRSDASGRPVNGPGRTPMIRWQEITRERLQLDGVQGQYRSRGVDWPTGTNITLEQSSNGTIVNLEVPNTRVVEEGTGLISFDTRLGGKAYLDPNTGSVRFSGVAPNRNAIILLSYTPRFLRISTVNNANYGTPSGVIDPRFISEYDYWANPNGTGIAAGAQIRIHRFAYTYGRAAAGAGQASRPYLKTMRMGVQLVNPASGQAISIHTQPNGAVTTPFTVAGNTGPFQVDPANGRIYFTPADEGRTVTVTFQAINDATGAPINVQNVLRVELITERNEAPVAIEQAVNETQMFSFIDPFDDVNAAGRRPGLIWMFWTSTRAGGPDVYMQTIAPKFTPKPRTTGGN